MPLSTFDVRDSVFHDRSNDDAATDQQRGTDPTMRFLALTICLLSLGILQGCQILTGDLGGWEPYRFALGNELTGDRPWWGTLYLVAIYARPLTPDEIQQNYEVGVPVVR